MNISILFEIKIKRLKKTTLVCMNMNILFNVFNASKDRHNNFQIMIVVEETCKVESISL